MERKDADLAIMLPMNGCKIYKASIEVTNEQKPERLPINKRIRYARLNAGFSAKQLAEKLGVGNDVISRYENNHTTLQGMDVDLLQRIAILCGMDKHFCMHKYHIFKSNSTVYINEYMTRNNLTNFAMAELMGISVTTVKQWKKGRCCPSYEVWVRWFDIKNKK